MDFLLLQNALRTPEGSDSMRVSGEVHTAAWICPSAGHIEAVLSCFLRCVASRKQGYIAQCFTKFKACAKEAYVNSCVGTLMKEELTL